MLTPSNRAIVQKRHDLCTLPKSREVNDEPDLRLDRTPLLGHCRDDRAEERRRSLRIVRCRGTCPATKVSFAELLAHPSEHHGKRIETTGYLYLEFEHMALYGQRRINNGIWVNIDHFPLETEADWERYERRYRLWRCKYSKHWVIVRGLYDMHPTGHMAPTHQGSIAVELVQLRSGQEKACRN